MVRKQQRLRKRDVFVSAVNAMRSLRYFQVQHKNKQKEISSKMKTQSLIEEPISKPSIQLCFNCKRKVIGYILATGMQTLVKQNSPLQMIDNFIAKTIVQYAIEQPPERSPFTYDFETFWDIIPDSILNHIPTKCHFCKQCIVDDYL